METGDWLATGECSDCLDLADCGDCGEFSYEFDCDWASASRCGGRIDDIDARWVRYALVGAYWNDRSSLWKLELLDPIALTERDTFLVSVNRLDSGGRFVSLCTRE